MLKVDARGDACPLPVVKAKKAIAELNGAGEVEVLVDNEIAVQNLTKMAQQKGYQSAAEKLAEREYRVLFTVGEPAAEEEEAPACAPDARTDTVVVIASDKMGEGAEELGKTLLKLGALTVFTLVAGQRLIPALLGYVAKIRDKIETLLEAHYRETFDKWLETERIVCTPSFRLPLAIHPTTHTDIYARSLYTAEDGDMNKLEEKLIVELTALPNVRWWHRNIARQDFAINGFIKHYPDILIMTQSGKLICAETKGEHLKNDDSREKIALGQAWRTAAGKNFRYYMVFENEENLLPGAVSMSQFIDTVKAL